MKCQLNNVNEVWRTMVYDYGIHYAVACQIIGKLQNGWTQGQIEAELSSADAARYAKFTFNNRIQFKEAV